MMYTVIPRVIRTPSRQICSVLSRKFSSDSHDDCVKCKYSDVDIPKINFTEFIVNDFGRYSNKIALECGVTKRKYTYDEVLVKANNLNKSLRKVFKLQKGDVVALFLPNIPEYYICILGVQFAGLKLTTINPTYTSGEIKQQLLDSHAKALITLPELWNNAKKAADETRNNINMVTIKNALTDSTPTHAVDFQELISSKIEISDPQLPSLRDTVFMPYSSGTTGLSKGVELSTYNIVANITQLHHPNFEIVQPTTDTHQDVTIAVLPFSHIYGLLVTLTLMVRGIKVITLPKFTPDAYINALRDHKPHILLVVPPIVTFFNSHPGVKSEYLSSLRVLVSGAAPLGALDEKTFREKVGKPVNVLQGYGLTETTAVCTLVPIDLQGNFPGSAGSPIPNTLMKVVNIEDKQGKNLGVNKIGELLIKGPQVMKGYYNKPELTAGTFLDGWFRTGDLVRYDENGMFYVADRIKELIKVKGLQVPPAELEAIIRNFPGVSEAAVIGIPHEYQGEAPRAYIVPKINSKVDVKKLMEHVESKVAKHKRLKGGIAIVDSIPKTASGKILRRQLKLKYEKEGV